MSEADIDVGRLVRRKAKVSHLRQPARRVLVNELHGLGPRDVISGVGACALLAYVVSLDDARKVWVVGHQE